MALRRGDPAGAVKARAPARRREAAPAPDPPLPALEFIQVAFAGHNRPGDLGDPAAALAGLAAAFALLRRAGVQDARLLTGVAPGADLLAVEAWQAEGLGPVHAVLPFLEDDDIPIPPELEAAATRLDGEATRARGRNPHLAQSRWLIGAADLLVVVWTGHQPRGPGGTADAVRLALEHATPVLWVQPGASRMLRLIRPEYLDEDFGFLEFLEHLTAARAPLVSEATPQSLHAALLDLGLEEAGARAADPAAPARPGKPWGVHDAFRRLAGGKAPSLAANPPPPDLAAQPGFASLSAARRAAADTARRLGGAHRSRQVILLLLAILVAMVGSTPALWPELKTPAVSLELLLALFALLVWVESARGERHLRWGEARKVAEDLRLARAAWALGVHAVPQGLNPTVSAEARRARRLAGLPSGAFDEARVAAWGAWAIDELITGQIAYHRGQSTIDGRISHRVRLVETGTFALLILLLVAYLVLAVALMPAHGRPPPELAGLVLMAGAVAPAIGAAGLALEATLSLGEQARRSRILADQLEALREETQPHGTLERLQSVVRAALRLERAQEDHWSEEVGRRRLFRGR
jgi:hypothetical protein